MKKIISFVALCTFLMQMSNALQLKQYLDFQNNEKTREIFEKGFDSSTDLIRGLIMLRDGALKEHRNFGNAEFHFKDSRACSRDDRSDDAMTQLLILTHPSTGGSGFNAIGEGSISQIFSDSNDLMQIIAGMFKIANAVRNRSSSKPSEDIECILKEVGNKRYSEKLRNAVLSCFSQNGKNLDLDKITRRDLINILESRKEEIQKVLPVAQIIKNKAESDSKVLDAVREILGKGLGLKENERNRGNLIAKSIEILSQLKRESNSIQKSLRKVGSVSSEEESRELITDSQKIREAYNASKKNKNSASFKELILSKLDEDETELRKKIIATEDDKLDELIHCSNAIYTASNTIRDNATKENLKKELQVVIGRAKAKIALFECVKQTALELSEDDLSWLVKGGLDIFGKVRSVESLSQQLQSKSNELDDIKNAIADGSEDILKEQLGKNTEETKKLKRKKLDKLVSLAKAVAGAVLLERTIEKPSDEDKWKKQPYCPGYTNDIICAYACGVISGSTALDDLKKLAENMKDNSRKYSSDLSEIVSANDSIFPSFIPFDVGQTPITNSSGILSNFVPGGFPDCVETTLRQLFSLLFCSGNNELALDRIPPNSKLMEFFKNRKIREAANDGSEAMRNAWAAICAGYTDKIRYSSPDGYEVSSGWVNMVRLICLLMTNYECKKNVAELIADINDGKKEIKTSEDVVDTLNTLLEVRDDVKLKAINCDLSEKDKEVFGHIKILPKAPSLQSNNALSFCAESKHAKVDKVESVDVRRIKNAGQIDKLLRRLFPKDKFERTEFYQFYSREKSNEKNGWVGLISSLLSLEKFAKARAVLKSWSCESVVATLKEILKTETKLEVIDHSLEVRRNGIFGAVKLKSPEKEEEIIISLNEDNVNSADSSGFQYIEDLYYNKGYAFIDKKSTSIKGALYPVLAFYTKKNEKKHPQKEAAELLDSGVGSSYFNGVYRAFRSFDFSSNREILDKLENSFEDYMELCINNEKDMSVLGEIVSYLSLKEKLDAFKEKISNRIKTLVSEGKTLEFRYRNYSTLFSPLALDGITMQQLAPYTEYVDRTLKKNSLERCDAITVIGWILSKMDLSNVSDTDESFQKMKKLVREFMIENNSRDFLLTDENLATSEKHLELLLPICSINDRTIADRVINQLGDRIDESIIPVSWRISDEKFDEFIKQIENDKFCREKYHALLRGCCSEDEKREKVLELMLGKFPNITDFLDKDFDYHFSGDDVKKILSKAQGGNVEKVCRWFAYEQCEENAHKVVGNWLKENRPDLMNSLLLECPWVFPTDIVEQFLIKTQKDGGDVESACSKLMMNGGEENIRVVARWAENNFDGFLNLLNTDNLRYFSVGAIEQFLMKIQDDTSLVNTACTNLVVTCEVLDGRKLREISKWMEENHVIYPLAMYMLDRLSDKTIHALLEKRHNEPVTLEMADKLIEHCKNMDLEGGKLDRFEFITNWVLDNYAFLEKPDYEAWFMLTSLVNKYASADTIKKLMDKSMKYGLDYEFYFISDMYKSEPKDSDSVTKLNSIVGHIFDNYPNILWTELKDIPSEILIDQLNRTKEQQISNSEYYDGLLATLLVNFSQETRTKIIYWILNNRSIDTIMNILGRYQEYWFSVVFNDFLYCSSFLKEPGKTELHDQLANRVLANLKSVPPFFAVWCYPLFFNSNCSEDLKYKFLEKINIDGFKDTNNLNFIFNNVNTMMALTNIREIFRQKSEVIPDIVSNYISYYESVVKGQIISQ